MTPRYTTENPRPALWSRLSGGIATAPRECSRCGSPIAPGSPLLRDGGNVLCWPCGTAPEAA